MGWDYWYCMHEQWKAFLGAPRVSKPLMTKDAFLSQITAYDDASLSATTYDYTNAQIAAQVPAMTYIVNSLTLNITDGV